MKTMLKLTALGTLLCAISVSASAQGTAFTYQGRLNDGANPANGTYNLRFILYTADVGGSQTGPILTNTVVPTNGLFTVTLDFGAVFNGASYWLDLAVRTNGAGSFTPLTTRQPLTPAPYAIFAQSIGTAALAGTYSNAVTLNNSGNTISGNFTGNGGGLTNVSAVSLGGLSSSGFWKTGGNAGTVAGVNFLGTTDNQPLEFRAGGQRAVQLQPQLLVTNVVEGGTLLISNAPNVIAGMSFNSVDSGVAGAFISGGAAAVFVDFGSGFTFYGSYSNHLAASLSTIGGGGGNLIGPGALFSMIGGGDFNTIETNASGSSIGGGEMNLIHHDSEDVTISGGSLNNAGSNSYSSVIAGGNQNQTGDNAFYTVIGGGLLNTILASDSVIGGGVENQVNANGSDSVIGGGDNNVTGGYFTTVPGGWENAAIGDYSFAAGRQAKANHQGAFVWADSTATDFASTTADQFLIRAAGGAGIGTAVTPPGGLRIHSGSLAVTGASSYAGMGPGTFMKYEVNAGHLYAYDYSASVPRPLLLNGPGGNVGVGRTPAANAFEVEGNASKTAAGSWLANSDARIKTDIHTVTHALEKLQQVRPVEFRYTADYRAQHPSLEDRPYLNVIAQEFQKVFPEAVKSGGDKLPDGEAILQVDTYPLTIYSAAAIQELNEKVEGSSQKSEDRSRMLEEQLGQKETELTELKQRLEALEKIVLSQKSN